MQNISKSSFYILIFSLCVNILSAQNKGDTTTIIIKKEAYIIKDKSLLPAQEQIGFGKLTIDTNSVNNIQKETLNELSARSVSIYMAIHEKEFKKWEAANFKSTQLNLYFAPTSIPSNTSFSFLGLPIAVSYMAPGKAATKLIKEGTAPMTPVHILHNKDKNKQIEYNLQEKRKESLKDEPEYMMDEVMCIIIPNELFIHSKNFAIKDYIPNLI